MTPKKTPESFSDDGDICHFFLLSNSFWARRYLGSKTVCILCGGGPYILPRKVHRTSWSGSCMLSFPSSPVFPSLFWMGDIRARDWVAKVEKISKCAQIAFFRALPWGCSSRIANLVCSLLGIPNFRSQNAFLMRQIVTERWVHSSGVGDAIKIMNSRRFVGCLLELKNVRAPKFAGYFFGPVVGSFNGGIFKAQTRTRFEISPNETAKRNCIAEIETSRAAWESRIWTRSPTSKCGARAKEPAGARKLRLQQAQREILANHGFGDADLPRSLSLRFRTTSNVIHFVRRLVPRANFEILRNLMDGVVYFIIFSIFIGFD